MDFAKYKKKASDIRLLTLDSIAAAKKGHIGGAFSCVDICVSLFYGGFLRFNPDNPEWSERDRFILSKGHVGSFLYAILADLGYFDKSELKTLNNEGRLGEHPDRRVPGIEITSGSLGHGLGIGAGIALAAKLDKHDNKTVILLGDGECYEGSVWEAAMFASQYQLNNMLAIVDRNGQCVNDFTENINKLEPLSEKWKSFGWEVEEVDGHCFKEIFNALNKYKNNSNSKPMVIIAETIKGKGVSFMERELAWHHGGISGEKYEIARNELMALMKEDPYESA